MVTPKNEENGSVIDGGRTLSEPLLGESGADVGNGEVS